MQGIYRNQLPNGDTGLLVGCAATDEVSVTMKCLRSDKSAATILAICGSCASMMSSRSM